MHRRKKGLLGILKWFLCVLTVCWFIDTFSFDAGDHDQGGLCGCSVWWSHSCRPETAALVSLLHNNHQLYQRLRNTGWCFGTCIIQSQYYQSERCKTLDKRPGLRGRIVVKDCLLKLNISLASFLWRRPVLPNRTEVSSSTVHAEGDCLPGLIPQEREAKHLIALQTVEQHGSISGLAVSLARKYEG